MEPVLLKTFLQDLEESGKTRSQFSLPKLVERKSSIYGEEGSEKRRSLQKKFDSIKRKSPLNYLKLLDKHDVEPGAGLKRELRLRKRNNRKKKKDESGSDSDSDVDVDVSSITSDGDDNDDDRSSKASFTKKEAPKKKPAKPKPAPTSPAPTSPASVKASGPSTPVKQSAPSPPIETNTMADTTVNLVSTLEAFKQDGTAEYPYVIIADPSKPETNQGFETSFISGLEFRNFKRDAYHIRKTTTPSQEEAWEASIPVHKYPTLANRSVLVRGPSQDYWHQSAERYHQEPFCSITKTVHETLETNIKGDIKRRFSHWLIVFPVGTKLENHILSDDAVHVKKNVLDLVDKVVLDGEEIEILGCDVYWRIALRGGEMIRSPENPNTGRFARRKRAGGSNADKSGGE